ncbi:protein DETOXIFICATION 14-like [Neltuma alba]|uniref:protein DETOXIFICATION 14-like n=1 Tax=Neltuma alba TaxID=207710 RepID=UPI0010A3659B|nr:protein DETOXIFICATION 14-like [Prosopis alba]XP_028757815.1 protein DETOXIFICATION 14-like [Prosopis alba]XP_028779712.1 protein DETOXIFICATION 14-like [Prosopis alba]XP_028779719.1 protein DETOXIFICATION 14-like [Prosopis alba]
MERSLLEKNTDLEHEEDHLPITWRVFSKEVKAVCSVAGPMVAVNSSTFFLQTIALMMVGHLGKLAQSSTGVAISLCAVTGFSVIFGLASALETLCGQAYGAKQYKKFGVQIQTGIFCLILCCLPLCVLWLNLGKLLVLLGQDPLIANEAGEFAVCLIPALFGYAILQALVRYYLMQSLISPLVLSSSFIICFHVACCWALVFKSGMGRFGGAFAIGISYWLNVILLALYMKFSDSCAKTRVPISMELFQGLGEFFRFAIPSAIMACLQWWSYEVTTLLAGLLRPNPELETSILAVCVSMNVTIYSIPESIGSAASARVSNALGAGSPQVARLSALCSRILATCEALIVSSIIFASRNVLGHVFSNEADVIHYVTDIAPLLVLSSFMDSLQGTLTGIARGSGWQHIGAYVNFGAYYVIGIPLAAILGFWLDMRAKGLWLGITTGTICQVIVLMIILSCTDWMKEVCSSLLFKIPLQ